MGASIYIADDEKNIRDLITKFLESDGYSVTAFETGDELMEEFLKKPCELVILDIMMPGTDGFNESKIPFKKNGYEHQKGDRSGAFGY